MNESDAGREFTGKIAALAERWGGRELEPTADGLARFEVRKENLREFVRALRDDPELRFALLLDVTAVDWSGREPRFEVVYHLYSMELRRRIRVRTFCREREAVVPSLVPVFRAANFLEREVFDMFGIRFADHPDLRRILLPEEYEHHPLRKEFPHQGIEPEKVYRMKGGAMMPRAEGADPIPGAGSTTP